MSLFATAATGPEARELPLLLEILFQVGLLVCFIRVLEYAVAKNRAGLLIDGPRAPLPLAPGRRGWWFALCVLALLFLQSPLYMVVVVFGLAGFTMEAGRSVREQFGLGRLSLRVILTWSLLVWGAVVFVELPLSQAVDWVMTRVHVPHPEQLSVEMFRSYHRAAQIAGFMAQAVLLSPLVEELFFRGFLLTFLKNYTSTWPALILSAGVFAFAHVNLDSVLQLWLLGVVLGLAYEHTGSLLLPVGIHACWNLLTALNILLEKGGFG